MRHQGSQSSPIEPVEGKDRDAFGYSVSGTICRVKKMLVITQAGLTAALNKRQDRNKIKAVRPFVQGFGTDKFPIFQISNPIRRSFNKDLQGHWEPNARCHRANRDSALPAGLYSCLNALAPKNSWLVVLRSPPYPAKPVSDSVL